jgi:hypothetical protein
MLWFFHPKPPSRKEVAMQVAERKAASVVDTKVIVVDHPRDRISRLKEEDHSNGRDDSTF